MGSDSHLTNPAFAQPPVAADVGTGAESALTAVTPMTDVNGSHSLPPFSPCTNCPFGGPKAKGRGNLSSPIVIVGESLGRNELRLGMPFVGPAGKVLWSAVPNGDGSGSNSISIDNGCYTTNAMACYPWTKDDPTKFLRGIHSCRARLLDEIRSYPRKIIITLGNPALWSLTGDFKYKITQSRGMPIQSDLSEFGILPAVHPAALLRGTDSYRVFKEDIRYAFRISETGRYKQPLQPKYIVCDTPEYVEHVGSILAEANEVAADYETSSFNSRTGYPLSLGLAADPELVYIVPGGLTRHLRAFAKKRKGKLIWHNGKFDIQWGNNHELEGLTVDEDTMLQSYALDESPGIHDLERCAGDLLGAADWKYKIKEWVKKKSDSYALIPPSVLHGYQALDVSNTLQIWQKQRTYIDETPATSKLYYKTLIPLSALLAQVESRGMYVDQGQVKKLGDQYVGDFETYTKSGTMTEGGELPRIASRINEIAGYDVNPNSPIQLGELMFDKFKINPIEGRSTNKEVLRKLGEIKPTHPIVASLLEWRQAQKSFATYVKSIWYYSNIEEVDGSIHGTFLIHGTRTGRLAMRKPNLQNVPRSPFIRACFIPRLGYIFVEIDLNQAELRSLAELSGDEYLVRLFNDNTRNLHDEMSEFLFPGWTTRKKEWQGKEERMRAKAVNFGIPYGREAGSIADEFTVPLPRAQSWIDGWFRRAPGAREFINKCRRAALRGQTITTCFGRKKRHWLVTRENMKDLMNEASNFPHQVIASDINDHNGMALQLPNYPHRVEKQLYEFDSHIVNLVHDSLLLEVPNDRATIIEVARIACENAVEVPRQWGLNKVPFLADAKVGHNWGSLKPLDEWLKDN